MGIDRIETTTIDQAMRGERSFIEVATTETVDLLWDRLVENVAITISSLPDGGGKTYNEARELGEKVARLTLGER